MAHRDPKGWRKPGKNRASLNGGLRKPETGHAPEHRSDHYRMSMNTRRVLTAILIIVIAVGIALVVGAHGGR